MRRSCCSAMVLAVLAGTLHAEGEIRLEGPSDQVSYSLGHQIGRDFKRQGVVLDAEAIARGIADGLAGAAPELSAEAMQRILGGLKREITADMESEALARIKARQAEAERLKEEGRAFLEANARKEGVVALPSGLQYRVLRAGEGPVPRPTDRVQVHYRARLLDGRELDSSHRKGGPASFRADGVIAGWSEALQRMPQGSLWELYIPWDLAYGLREPLAYQTVILEVELLAVGEGESAAPGPVKP